MYLYIHQMSACSAMHLPWNLTMFSSFGIQTKCTLIHILWNTVSIRKKKKNAFPDHMTTTIFHMHQHSYYQANQFDFSLNANFAVGVILFFCFLFCTCLVISCAIVGFKDLFFLFWNIVKSNSFCSWHLCNIDRWQMQFNFF